MITMKRLNQLFLVAMSGSGDLLGRLYAKHRLHHCRDQAADMRDNIRAEQHAIRAFDVEAHDIEMKLLKQALGASRAKTALLEDRDAELTGSLD